MFQSRTMGLIAGLLASLLWWPAVAPTATNSTLNALAPVVLRAGQLPALDGIPAERLRLMKAQKGRLIAMPFQIDQKDSHSRFLLTSTPKALAQDDEIVWMAGDMGERIDFESLQQTAEGSWHEIRLMGYQGAEPGYAYLYAGPNPPALSTQNYVHYTEEGDLLRTESYYSGFRNIIVADRLGWVTSDGKPGPNVLTNVSVRFQARALLGLVPVDVTEKDLKSRIVGYKEGPVRLIKRIESAPNLGLGIRGPSNVTEGVFYRGFMQTIVKIHFPLGAAAILSKANFQINLDAALMEQPIDLHLPGDRVFALAPELAKGPYVLQKDPPRWIHFSSPSVDHSFAAVIDIPKGKSEVLRSDELLYDQKMEGQTIGTLHFKVHIKPKSGDHFFYMYLFAPPARSHRDPESIRQEMQEIDYALAMVERNQTEQHPWLQVTPLAGTVLMPASR